jgi:uncharacterized protein with FMN-binding domain
VDGRGIVSTGEAPGPPTASPTRHPSERPKPPSGTPATPTPQTAQATVVVNGTVAQTRWGPVQVQVRLIGHKITDVVPLIYPNGDGNDQSINAYALPRLRQEVLSAQSAQIDSVSGATVTSDGYRRSLQAALDAARFGG